MSVQQLTWDEISELEEGDRVIVLKELKVYTDPSDPDPDLPVPDYVRVPVNTEAVVETNQLSEHGHIALKPDDLGLRAELQDVLGLDVFILHPPFGNIPPPKEDAVWGQLGPIGQSVE
jgi:hypothetical protein